MAARGTRTITIEAMLQAGRSASSIARELGVSRPYVQAVKRRARYAALLHPVTSQAVDSTQQHTHPPQPEGSFRTCEGNTMSGSALKPVNNRSTRPALLHPVTSQDIDSKHTIITPPRPSVFPRVYRDHGTMIDLSHKPVDNRKQRPDWVMNNQRMMEMCVGRTAMRRFKIAQMYWRNNMSSMDIATSLDMSLGAVEHVLLRLGKLTHATQ